MTFRQIIDDAAERLGNLQPEARVRFRRHINEWYRRLLTECSLPRGTAATSLAVVASTKTYTLASTIGRLQTIYDPTNNITLEERPLSWMRDADPTDAVTGVPQYYAYVTDRVIKLYPVPSANNTVYIDHDADITEMDDDADVPIVPEDFHYLLSLGIRLNEYEKNSDARYNIANNEMDKGVAKLRHWVASRLKNVSNPARFGSGTRPSRLGGWYPGGS